MSRAAASASRSRSARSLLSCAQPDGRAQRLVAAVRSRPPTRTSRRPSAALAKSDAGEGRADPDALPDRARQEQARRRGAVLLGEAQLARARSPSRPRRATGALVEDYPKSAQNVEAALRAAQLYQKLEPRRGRPRGARARDRGPRRRRDAREAVPAATRIWRAASATGPRWCARSRSRGATRRTRTQLTEIDAEVADLLEVRLREPELEALAPRLPRGPGVRPREPRDRAARARARRRARRARRARSPAAPALRRATRPSARSCSRARRTWPARRARRSASCCRSRARTQKVGESILRGIALRRGPVRREVVAAPPAGARLGRRGRARRRGGDRARGRRRRRDHRPGALGRGGRGRAARRVGARAAALVRAPRRHRGARRVRLPARTHSRRPGGGSS